MCALVLALRKVPIYGPGSGGAALGSSDMPSYSVNISDAEAAANRTAFTIAKQAKRMMQPTKSNQPNPNVTTSDGLGLTSPVVSSLRNRAGTITSPTSIATGPETAAMSSLNARHPTSDPAHNWESDSSQTLGSPIDQQRSTDLEEVRNVLRRESTRGKRRTTESTRSGAPGPGIPTISEPDTSPYHDYMASQGQVSVGPRLPIKRASEGFGVSFEPFQQHPPKTPPKNTSPRQGKKVQSFAEGSPRPGLGGGRNNSFAQDREDV